MRHRAIRLLLLWHLNACDRVELASIAVVWGHLLPWERLNGEQKAELAGVWLEPLDWPPAQWCRTRSR